MVVGLCRPFQVRPWSREPSDGSTPVREIGSQTNSLRWVLEALEVECLFMDPQEGLWVNTRLVDGRQFKWIRTVGVFRCLELVVPCQYRWKYKELARELRSNDASVVFFFLTVEERNREK